MATSESYILIHGFPQTIRTDYGSGFKENCRDRGIKHILTPVGDYRGKGLVERSIQTIKRKLAKEKLHTNF